MKNNSEYLLKSLLRDDPDQEWLDTYHHLIFIIDSQSMSLKDEF